VNFDTLGSRFKDGNRPPSWICWARICTTHKEHLLVYMDRNDKNCILSIVLTAMDQKQQKS